jgi:hypothetical protein
MFTEKKIVEGLSANMNVTTSKGINIDKLKATGKSKGVTINDVVLAAFTTSLNDIMSENEMKKPKDQRKELPEKLNIVMPANIRFGFYPSREKVKYENKFTAVPLQIPLTKSMSTAYDKVKSVTKEMKSSFGLIYGIYWVARWIGKLNPRFFNHLFIDQHSKKFTAGFSNTPGPLKPFRYEDKSTGEVMKVMTSNAYVMLAGNFGFTLSALSNNDKLSLAIVSDENCLPYALNKRMVHSIYGYIMEEIEKFEE